jgi:hypothetical protein
VLLVESPSATDLRALATSYARVPSRELPRHAETYRMIAATCGFERAEVLLGSAGSGARLRALAPDAAVADEVRDTVNWNIAKLNEVLHPDAVFAVLCTKAGSSA